MPLRFRKLYLEKKYTTADAIILFFISTLYMLLHALYFTPRQDQTLPLNL